VGLEALAWTLEPLEGALAALGGAWRRWEALGGELEAHEGALAALGGAWRALEGL